MLDLNDVKNQFAELTSITPLSQVSGQRDVCKADSSNGPVALKIFKRARQAEDRLNREVAAIAKLGSEFVPEIYDFGTRELGGEERLYVVEQWVEGSHLQDILNETKPLPLDQALNWCKFLLNASLDFESKSIVHRDIKPNNLMQSPDGRMWVLDFGIVRHLDLVSLTETKHALGLGTFGYGAPEQMRNIKVKINARADLFSIGVVVYELLTGINPYREGKGDWIAIMKHMESQDLPRLSLDGDDGSFSEFIAALTQRYPSRRPQTSREAVDWFEPIYQKLSATN